MSFARAAPGRHPGASRAAPAQRPSGPRPVRAIPHEARAGRFSRRPRCHGQDDGEMACRHHRILPKAGLLSRHAYMTRQCHAAATAMPRLAAHGCRCAARTAYAKRALPQRPGGALSSLRPQLPRRLAACMPAYAVVARRPDATTACRQRLPTTQSPIGSAAQYVRQPLSTSTSRLNFLRCADAARASPSQPSAPQTG